MRRILTLSAVSILIGTSSCNEMTCRNSNPVLDSKTDQGKAYKAALAEKLRSLPKESITYIFEGYKKEGDKETIVVEVHGSDLCARMPLVVNDWTKLAGVRRETSGYRGAEVKGLQYDITEVGNGDSNSASDNKKDVVFVYRDLERLID